MISSLFDRDEYVRHVNTIADFGTLSRTSKRATHSVESKIGARRRPFYTRFYTVKRFFPAVFSFEFQNVQKTDFP